MSAWLKTYGAPLVLGLLVLAGLVGALRGDGGWDYAGNLLIAAPIIVSVWSIVAARRR